MNSSYVNMGVGALLATLFVLKSVSLASGFIFHSETPEKPGFAIVATEEPAAGGDKGAAAKAETPIAQLLQKADAKAGEAIFKKCQACHSGEKGGPNKVGPDLWGIVDRPVAEHEGFAYSAGMKEFSKGGSEKWTYDHLYHFLAAPKKFVAGTAMGFAGLPKEEDRANVIAYLRTLADTQVPLPDPNAPAATN
ncbi:MULTISPECIES: cytochrome c family protein [Rhizobium]|uniref:Cytochrome c family protein n=1 Tax=Rhizobium tropici TaxID=398 RepID=A0A329YIV6_RHITR|nr:MULTISPECIES: cytochrome c family protein [Rhizobium]MBB3290723.1 cytochrome c [Rhizobium sp. BK252]MBB3405503.1 cytochrome c [Rhizobium sp. BK289]MBB3417994.1 cytochrome c [Rhizobium sp. BK284]MBB3485929.1 cytochrome c [Rhizobium sp. BK347]MDK4723349.1 cytochrome c family protein [Rhizobium sp. CNPSo 3968]